MSDIFPVGRLRSDFPILSREIYGKKLVYLDNTASTQTPRQVVEAVEDMYYLHKANVHRGVHTLSQEATEMMEATRREVADFIGAPSTQEVIFTRGTTEAINLVASSFGQLLGQGDEIILSVMEHHANIVPWQLLRARRGVVIKVVPMLPDGSLDMHAYRSLLSPRTRMVAITHVSNVLGTVNPVAEIIRLAHEAGAVCLIDGAQAIAHIPVDVAALGADFYVFSSHKMYGPCGIGVLYGRRELLEKMPPYQGGGEMIGHVTFEHTTWAELPFKFEAGTPDYVGIAAFRQALAYIQAIGLDAIASHEERLLDHASRRIAAELPQVTVYGTAPGKAAIISFNLGNAHPYDTGMLLDKLGIACRTGHHCAQPLMAALGIEGTVRASFALYNTIEEADAFVDGLLRIAPMLT
ncbi:MAG: cysteine desulfurase [Muribaculaceae bacterium]|jgi:cysteine desulfurase/selenocysteine lyase|nr:cysteine desulfurase [Muribaculaceae bacterium]